MSSPPTLTMLALTAWLFGCGQRTTDAEDAANADHVATEPDLPQGELGDPWHCGESDAKCVGPLGIGDCIDGECQGRLFDCWTSGSTCTEACAANPGSSCAPGGCDGATAFGWSTSNPDEAVEACSDALETGATPLTIGCDDPLPFADFPGIRCCCLW